MANTPDDGFHEIQLNGKQLVFLFMAATVVSVVIFLCGVLVGRGVRAERGMVAQEAALNETPAPDAVASTPQTTGASIQAGADPRAAAPPPPADDFSYFNRLEKSNQPAEEFKPAAAKPAQPPTPANTEKSPAAKPAAAPVQPNLSAALKASKEAASKDAASKDAAAKAAALKDAASKDAAAKAAALKDAAPAMPGPAVATPPPTAVASVPAAAASPGGDGYAVQVAAVNLRSDADAIAKRLATKGYTSYVEMPPNSTGTVFRVRVGTFKTRREAELIAAKLQKEEQIKPWVTR